MLKVIIEVIVVHKRYAIYIWGRVVTECIIQRGVSLAFDDGCLHTQWAMCSRDVFIG